MKQRLRDVRHTKLSSEQKLLFKVSLKRLLKRNCQSFLERTNSLVVWSKISIRKSARYGSLIIFSTAIAFYVDSLISDDEPLWEPVEWSLWQSWIFFIFFFSWIAENLITSRYGSYTGRDKRVWFAWYKALWLFELWWMHCVVISALFIITPFYFEITYPTASPVLYWQWYTRAFFVRFSFVFCTILLISNTFLVSLRWLNWKKLFFLTFIINCLLAYLLYFHFITVLFGYFTDNTWYSKSAWTEYACFGQEPSKWSYGPKDRDHFTYHHTPSVFWYKNDIPFAAALMFTHIFYFIALVILYWQWILILRRLYSTHEISYTFAMYGVASLRHFYYFSLLLYFFVAFSWIFQFMRAPFEYAWFQAPTSFLATFWDVLCAYPLFLLGIFF